MPQKLIALDLDDVTFDYARALLTFYNDPHPSFHHKPKRILSLSDLTSYNLRVVLNLDTPEQHDLFMFHFENSKERKRMRFIPEARENILKLLSMDYRFVLITDSNVDHYKRITEKLNSNLPGAFVAFRFTQSHTGGGPTEKYEICQEYETSIAIDDYVSTALKYAEHDIKCLLFPRPWNLHFNCGNYSDMIERVTWSEIPKHPWLKT